MRDVYEEKQKRERGGYRDDDVRGLDQIGLERGAKQQKLEDGKYCPQDTDTRTNGQIQRANKWNQRADGRSDGAHEPGTGTDIEGVHQLSTGQLGGHPLVCGVFNQWKETLGDQTISLLPNVRIRADLRIGSQTAEPGTCQR